jgi:hypothetical protein
LLQRLADRLDRWSSVGTIALAVALYAFYLASVMPAQSLESHAYAGNWGGPDRHFFYTPDELYARVATWGEAGRRQYIKFRLGLDIGFAFSYAAFLITVTGVALRKAWPGAARRRRLLLLALIPMSCDLLENALGIGLVRAFPARFDALAWLTTCITALKWISLALAHLVMVYALWAACRSAFRRDPLPGAENTR